MNEKPRYNPNIHNRRSIRLKGYDYGQAGLYFISICCQDRACLFGEIIGVQNFEPLREQNNESPNKNGMNDVNGAENFPPLRLPSKTIGSIVRGFKIGVTKWFRNNTDYKTIWQRNYHEHIIRNEKSYKTISEYIINNPVKWQYDKFYKK